MSGLSAYALGLTAARAVKYRTWADDRVYFETSAALDIVAPAIAIYAGRGRSEVRDGDILNGVTDVRLRFEFWLPPQFTVSGLVVDMTASQALPFALFWRQVETVLLTDLSPWAKLWRQFRLRIATIEYQRDPYETDKGQKLVVEIVELHIETLAEPAIGLPACGVWADLIAAMNADGQELSALGDLFAAQLQGSPEPLPSWQVDMGLLGTTDDAVQALDLGPLENTTPAVVVGDARDAPFVETVTIPITPLPDP